MVRDEIHAAVEASVEQVLAECESADPAKAAQLRSHISTVHMCIDQLLDAGAAAVAETAPPDDLPVVAPEGT